MIPVREAVNGGTGNVTGIWAFRAYDCSVALAASEPGVVNAPKDFALQPCYPNPFNGTARVTFDLPNESSVTITAYDITGRTVALLAEGRL